MNLSDLFNAFKPGGVDVSGAWNSIKDVGSRLKDYFSGNQGGQPQPPVVDKYSDKLNQSLLYTPSPDYSPQAPYKVPENTSGGGLRGVPDYTFAAPPTQKDPLAEMIRIANENTQRLIDEARKKGAEFDAKNPFAFDDVLAQKRKEVGARLDPYYTQTMDDYLRGVNTKRTRSLEDERTVIDQLSQDADQAIGKTKELLQDALDQSSEGFADSGLFASGKALRGQGQILNASDTEVGNINTGLGRKTDALALGNKRLNEDLTYDEGIKRRDLNQEKYYNIETGALNETDLAQKRRELERNQYIGQPYSSGSLSNFLGSINSNI